MFSCPFLYAKEEASYALQNKLDISYFNFLLVGGGGKGALDGIHDQHMNILAYLWWHGASNANQTFPSSFCLG